MVYIDYKNGPIISKIKYFIGRYITGLIEGTLPPHEISNETKSAQENTSRKDLGLDEVGFYLVSDCSGIALSTTQC